MSIYGLDEDKNELLGSGFLVRPNLLITAGHVVNNDKGAKYQHKAYLFDDRYIQLPLPFYLNYKEEYEINDVEYHDLAIHCLEENFAKAFILSDKAVS